MLKRLAFCAMLLAAVSGLCPAQAAQFNTWLCYYGTSQGSADYGRFDLVVLDGLRHPPLARRGPGRPLLLGYVSVGEERPGGPSWMLVQNQDFVIGRNRNTGAQIIDMRSAKWQAIVLDIIIPKIMEQGFDGVFLDTIDSAMTLAEGQDPALHKDMRAGIVEFLRRVRTRFPGIHIGLNRGLDLLAEVAPVIDSVLIEALSFDYDLAAREYRPVAPQVRQALVAAARQGLAANPRLAVLTLDYAGPEQQDRINEAAAYSRSKGFVPYVSTFALDRIYFHTLGR